MKNELLHLNISNLRNLYKSNSITPADVLTNIRQRSKEYAAHNIWIHLLTEEEIQPYLDALQDKPVADLPLYGIPFAIKDNIDLADIPTTAACPDFAYTPTKSAHLVQQLIKAGAIPVGKTNMDQFATGLVGTRSPEPWGPCRNAFDPDYISGGSSAGSAVAVSLGLASFALGTDTAGSGRVPAMLNHIYGLKPSRGLLSMSGVVPACRSLDCPSIFALSPSDAQCVFDIAAHYDQADSYARANPYSNSHRYWGLPDTPPVIAIPKADNLAFFGDNESQRLFEEAINLWQQLGATIKEIDMTPLLEAAKLLYEGPWVAERYAALESMMTQQPEAMHPVVHGIIASAEQKNAVEVFQYEYRMQAYRRTAQQLFADIDFLVTPTAPTIYPLQAVLDNPVELNSNMGYYTNYMNLLDLCGISIPVNINKQGLPFGITLIAPAMQDQRLLCYAQQWQQHTQLAIGAVQTQINDTVTKIIPKNSTALIAVCGAHLSGMPLNWQLKERGGELVESSTTSPNYHLYALPDSDTLPERPGLMRSNDKGQAIEIEIWSLPTAELGSFVHEIPAPLGLGKVETHNGDWVTGFICEPYALNNAQDITDLGSWRTYIHS